MQAGHATSASLSPATSARSGTSEVDDALEGGACRAQQMLEAGLIEGAALRLLGSAPHVGAQQGSRQPALPPARFPMEAKRCLIGSEADR